MKALASMLLALLVLAAGGCTSEKSEEQIPAQDYMSYLGAFGKKTGEISGRISYPSEYNQRSTVFSINDIDFVTYPDGRFLVRRLPEGEHRLTVNISGFEPYETSLVVREGQQLETDVIEMVMARGEVVGRMVDDKGRSAVGMHVLLNPTGGMAVTDKDGIFHFIGVRKGTHTLTIKDNSFFAKNKHFDVKGSEKRNLGLIHVYRKSTPQNRAVGLRND